jgi:hypothetical protein
MEDLVVTTFAQTRSPSPSPSETSATVSPKETKIFKLPPPSTFDAWAGTIAILLALVGGIIGYRIIRGGRGL